jgi:hypothetical protein
MGRPPRPKAMWPDELRRHLPEEIGRSASQSLLRLGFDSGCKIATGGAMVSGRIARITSEPGGLQPRSM